MGLGVLAIVVLGAGAAVRPMLVLAILVCLVCVTALALHPSIAVLALIVAAPLETTVVLPGQLGALGLTKLAGLLALVAVAAHALVTRHRFRGDATQVLGLLLLSLALLSAAVSSDPGTSLATALRLAGYVLLLIVIIEFGRDVGIRTMMWTYLVGTTAVVVPALVAFAAGRITLVRTPLSDPNDFGVLVAIALPMAMLLAGPATTFRGGRLLAAVCGAICSLGLLLTLSRGAIVAVAVGVIVHLAIEPRHRRAVVATMVAGAGFAMIAVALLSPVIVEALARKQVSAEDNVLSRLTGWRLALELSLEHPVFGIGPGLFGDYYAERTDTPSLAFGLHVVHNTYLGVLGEIGLPALVTLLALLVLPVLRLNRMRHAAVFSEAERDVVSALRTTLVIAMVAAGFTNQEYNAPLWMLVAFAGTLTAVFRERGAG